ncbi:MAG: M2 family metallopeptidase [Gemmatimonadota bacterium]
MTNPRAIIDDIVSGLKPLVIAVNRAWWDAAVSGDADAYQRLTDLRDTLDRFWSDDQRFNQLETLNAAPPDDRLLARSIELLYLKALPRRVEPELTHRINALSSDVERIFATYQPLYRGEPRLFGYMEETLKRERDPAKLEEAYEATKAVGPALAPQLHELVELRNEAARTLGFPDYYHMRLKLEEQDPDDVARFLENVEAGTAQPFKDTKAEVDDRLSDRFGVRPAELMPWHYQDPFFQDPPVVLETDRDEIYAAADLLAGAERFFNGIGLAISHVLARSSLHEAVGKDPHAFATDIDREGDVRILLNLRPNERWMGTTLHELGHAVYDDGIAPELPWELRQPAHTLTTEAIAMLFGRLSRSTHWLQQMDLIDPGQAACLAGPVEKELRSAMLFSARWIQVMAHFERAMYAEPNQDLNALWWRLVERFQGLTPPPRPAGGADYAAKIHVVAAPVYYHNYLYGECFASQIDACLRADVLGEEATYVGNKDVGVWLTDHIFRPGAGSHYDELARAATGEAVGSKAFGEQFLVQRAA